MLLGEKKCLNYVELNREKHPNTILYEWAATIIVICFHDALCPQPPFCPVLTPFHGRRHFVKKAAKIDPIYAANIWPNRKPEMSDKTRNE
jgi:hypothetical protein